MKINEIYSGIPIYQDSTDSFFKLNGLDPYNDPNCFLLRNDTVIFPGNPVRDKDSFNRVMEILKKVGAKYDDLTLDFLKEIFILFIQISKIEKLSLIPHHSCIRNPIYLLCFAVKAAEYPAEPIGTYSIV